MASDLEKRMKDHTNWSKDGVKTATVGRQFYSGMLIELPGGGDMWNCCFCIEQIPLWKCYVKCMSVINILK